jgi:uncharacterized protein YdhG (YjbR/CyaY superfamily)
MSSPQSIDDYIVKYPAAIQSMLQQMRNTIKKAAPGATEKISYGMPTYYLNGNLVHFAAYKNHIGFYPAPSGLQAFQHDIENYKHSKGAVQFPLDKPLPLKLVTKIVKYRVKANEAKVIRGKNKNFIKNHKDGSLWVKGKMLNDEPDGYWEWYRKDGTLLRSGYFKKGRQVGEWTTYDKHGLVYKTTQMK